MLAVMTALATLVTGLVVTFSASPANADTFYWRETHGQNSGKCTDVRTEDNTTVQLWDCFHTANQTWRFQYAGTSLGVDFYYVISRANQNRCMGVAGDSLAASAPIQMQNCFTGFTQWWYFRPHNVNGVIYNEFVNIETGLCLHAAFNSRNNGTILQQYYCNGSSAQYWLDVKAPVQ
jgi:hypothetical protein